MRRLMPPSGLVFILCLILLVGLDSLLGMLKLGQHGYEYVYHPHHLYNKIAKNINSHTASKTIIRGKEEDPKSALVAENSNTEFCPYCAFWDKIGSFTCEQRAGYFVQKYGLNETQAREAVVVARPNNCVKKKAIWLIEPISSPIIIFYNVYFGSTHPSTLDVIQEQMDQVGASYAAEKGVTVLYTTVGIPHHLNATYMAHLCSVRNSFRCQHLNHYYTGHEEVTLEHLYDFCRDRKDRNESDIRVAYMHNKGSKNSGMSQNIWRRISTLAMTSQLCLEPQDDQCNTCGLSYGGYFFGNFWTAKCSYVSKLLSPNHFMHKKNHLSRIAMRNYTHLDWNFHPTHMGTGRYSNEHWVTSHPSVMPCDLDANGMWWYWQGNGCIPTPLSCRPELKHVRGRNTLYERTPEEFVWSMAPRGERDARKKNETDLNDHSDHLDPTLGRSLFMWFHLYGEAPPLSSWVWEYFPDGARWKVGVQRYGKDVVDRLLPVSA
jgi:hypothetical protein